jgi:WD40 repeat protein
MAEPHPFLRVSQGASTGKQSAVLRGHEGPVIGAAFSPDGSRVVTASPDKTARIWGATTGEESMVLRGHVGVVTGAAFNPDGSRIVTSSWDETARIWDATTGMQSAALRGHRVMLLAPCSTAMVRAL